MRLINFRNLFGNQNLHNRSGFTLLELVISIGIIAILGAVSVLVLNPAETFRQSRDINRISDVQTLNSALVFYRAADNAALGSANTIYISLPSDLPDCSNLGLSTLPVGWSYACQPTASYRNLDGTGWIPVDFTVAQGVVGTLFSSLPIDPINTLSGDYYHTYIHDSSWALSATLESIKYLASPAATDGGASATRFEVGIDVALNSNLSTGSELSSAKAMTAFSFASPAETGIVTEGSHTVAISVTNGTDVTALVPTISISALASVSPLSGAANDFTNPVTYTVTAENGSTQNYVMTVTVRSAIGSITNYPGTGANPTDIAFDGTNMWTANETGDSVTKIAPDGTMTSYAGVGNAPSGIAFNSVTGDMWTVNYNSNSVTKITPAGGITEYPGTMGFPLKIAFDGTNMWTVSVNSGVTKFTPAGSPTNYAGNAASYDIALNSITGDMWTADYGNASVTKFTPAGTATTYVGTGANPRGIAFNSVTGDMWTANYAGVSVTKVPSAGTPMTTYSLGTVTAANRPYSIAFDGTNMWTANFSGNSVKKIAPNGTVSTYSAGAGTGPISIAFDGTNMWTANYANNSVTKIVAR